MRENNQKANKTWTYSYDNNGNILSKSEYTYTITDLTNITPNDTISYGYVNTNWADQLTSYDGTSITYDESGKPLNWTDNRNLTWEGTTLTSIGNTNYIYDADGILQSVGNNNISYDSKGNIESYKGITYKYDESGKPIGFGDNYFIYNQEGDVVKIYNTTLNSVVITYEYDAFGNVVNTTYRSAMYDNLSQKNIYKYRGSYGYFYEINSDTYYLKTRFYDPQAGRFLSPDNTDYLGTTGTTISYNLYCYCENNVANASDPYGNFKIALFYDSRTSGIFGGYIGGRGFCVQGSIWKKAFSSNFSLYTYTFDSISKFVKNWNSAAKKEKTFDALIIICHGAVGSLDCNYQRLLVNGLYDNSFSVFRMSQLKKIQIKKFIFIIACNAGTCTERRDRWIPSIAQEFSRLNSCVSYAARNTGVNINYKSGTASLDDKNKGQWMKFWYENNKYCYSSIGVIDITTGYVSNLIWRTK